MTLFFKDICSRHMFFPISPLSMHKFLMELSTNIKASVLTQFKGGFLWVVFVVVLFSFILRLLKARDRTEATRRAAKTHVHV